MPAPEKQADTAKSGLMLTRLGLGGSYLLNRDSPLLRQNSGTSAGIGLMWTWKRSSQPAWGGEE